VKHYAIVGASRGTGLEITKRLASEGDTVRAISRHPPSASERIEPFVADVTDRLAMERALNAQFDAVFFTVDVTGGMGDRGLFGSRKRLREVTYQGCLNAIAAASRHRPPPTFVLLSVMGADRASITWGVLNAVKGGLKQIVLDREQALIRGDLPYVIVRAPILTDEPGGKTPITATEPTHKLDAKLKIARADLAEAMVQAAKHAPPRSIWDVFAGESSVAPAWLTGAETSPPPSAFAAAAGKNDPSS
jgi:nucleoside-diphosphate-sugar epimerase